VKRWWREGITLIKDEEDVEVTENEKGRREGGRLYRQARQKRLVM